MHVVFSNLIISLFRVCVHTSYLVYYFRYCFVFVSRFFFPGFRVFVFVVVVFHFLACFLFDFDFDLTAVLSNITAATKNTAL